MSTKTTWKSYIEALLTYTWILLFLFQYLLAHTLLTDRNYAYASYDLVHTKTSNDTRQQSVVYSIPCGGYSAVYYGETARGMERRLEEHRSDLRHHRTTNSLVLHAEEHGHLPRLENSEALHTKLERKKRKLVEAANIATSVVTNHREDFVSQSRPTAKLTLRDQSARSP